MRSLIEIDHLTKDYGHSRGLFDVHLEIEVGEVFGLVGINGAGKTTMIRHLMGFLRPGSGRCSILGQDCWSQAASLKRHIGYVPGEIAFPDAKTGFDFFTRQADFLGLRDMSRVDDLVSRFHLDADASLKRMSKGMKQKTAIIAGFMSQAPILLLDEPTTGLDPLMQRVFIELIAEEKANGRTVFMSSHMFNELEATCDRVGFLKQGCLIDVVSMSDLGGDEKVKDYKIEFTNRGDYEAFLGAAFTVTRQQEQFNQVSVQVADDDVNSLFTALADYDLRFISQVPRTLATAFNQKYHETEVHHV